MDEKQLQFLFDNYAKDKGFKDIHEFRDLMNDGASRKVFFDESNKELGFKDYDEFEHTLDVKKKDNGVLPSKPLATPSPLPVQETKVPNGQLPSVKNSLEQYGIKAPVIPKEQSVNQPTSTTSVQPNITASYDDFVAHNEEKKAKHGELVKQAIDNAAKKVLKNKGVIKPEEEGKALNLSQFQQLTTEKKRLQDAYDKGDATFAISKDGEVGLNKTIGFVDALTKGWNKATQANDEAADFVDMDAEHKVDYLKKKEIEQAAKRSDEYLGERASNAGSIGQLAGENAPFLGKAAIGAGVGSAIVATSPFTGGVSLAGLPAATGFLFTANDSKNQGIQSEVTRRFYQLKHDNPNANDIDLMKEAEKGTLSGGLAGIATNAALMSGVETPLSNMAKGVVGKSIAKAVGNTVYAAGATAGIEGAKMAEGNLEGIKATPTEIAKHMGKTFSETASTLGILHVMTGAVSGALQLPNVVKSAFKYALTDANPTEVKSTLDANVKAGTITPEVAEKTQTDLDQYKVALSKTPNGLSPEAEASVAGLIQAKDKLIAEMKTKDDTAKPYYEEKIAGINEQIQKTVNTGKPYAHEIDEISGDKYTSSAIDKSKVEENRKLDLAEIDKKIAELPKDLYYNYRKEQLEKDRKDINDYYDNYGSGNTNSNLQPSIKLSEPIQGLDEQGIPIPENTTENGVTIQPPQSIPEPITIGNEAIQQSYGDKTIETDKAIMKGSYTNKVTINDEEVSLPKAGFVVSDVNLKEGVEKGKGGGQEIYKQALDKYGIVYSSHPISEDALNAQNALQKKGIITIREENIGGNDFRVLEKINADKTLQNEPTTGEANKPVSTNTEQSKGQEAKGGLPISTEPNSEGEPKVTTPVLEGGDGGKEPPKEEGGNGIHVDDRRTILSHRGLQEIATEFGLEDVVPRDRKSDLKLQKDAENTANDWKEKGEYEKNITGLIEKAENGEPLSDEQRLLLQQHLSNVREKTAQVKAEHGINSKEYDDQLKELSRLKEAGQKARSAAGAALRIPNISSIPDNSLEGWMAEKMESTGTDKLTDAQKAEVEKQHSDYEEKLKKSDELLSKAKEEIANLKAEAELRSANKKAARKKDQASLKVERDEIAKSIKEKWKNAGKETMAVSVPYAQQLIAIAPDVAKLTRNLIDTGTSKLADIIDNIHETLKDVDPNITKADVRDLIAGEYNEKKPTKSALEQQLRDVRDEAKLIKKLGDLQNGVKGTPKSQEKRNQEITSLKKQIKDFKADNPDLEAQLKTIKSRNETAEKKLLEDIKNKKFDNTPRIPFDENAALKKANPKLYKEAMDAIVAKNEARDKFELAKRNDELSKRSKLKKALDFGSKLISTSKAVKAGIDDSVTFVQLGMAVLANPKSALKAKIEAIKDINNNRFKRQLAALHQSPYWNTIQSSGLDITEPKSLTKENVEELYSGNLLDQPIKGVNLWTYTGGIFERIFTSMGNNLRLNMFMKRMEYLQNQGMTFDSHPKEYKDAARVINEMTGRGKVNPHLQAAMPAISPIIWAPRMLSSTLNTLGLNDIAYGITGKKGYYRSLTREQQKYAGAQMAKGLGMGIAVMTALGVAGWSVDTDPESSTFGNVKHGTTSYNVFGRYAGLAKALVQVVMGKKKTSYGETDLDAKGGRGQVVGKFLRGKMTPFSGEAYDYIFNSQQNSFTKQPINLQSIPNDLITPISVNDLKNGLQQDGSIALLTRFLPAVEGIQVMDDRDFKQRNNFNNEISDFVKNKQLNIPAPSKKYTDDDEKKEMTDDEFEKYVKNRAKRIEHDLSLLKNNGLVSQKTDKESLQREVTKIVSQAGEDARLEVLKKDNKPKTNDAIKNYRPLPVHPTH